MKIYLGEVKKSIKGAKDIFIEGEKLWLSKHSWDCGWYWGFGYIGNKNLHTQCSIFVEELLWHQADSVFEESIFDKHSFWIFKDLLVQAYALEKAAEVYVHGGHCTHAVKEVNDIRSESMQYIINQDLEQVLDDMWGFLEKLSAQKDSK